MLLKDMLRHYFNSKKQIPIESLIRPMQLVPENMKIADCLKFLQQLHYHLAIVTSEYGTTLGLVTMEDILEELVGDIHDEGDEEHPIVEQKNDQTYVVDASASISDVNDHLPIALPEGEDYDTVAGYINHLFGRIPSLHEKIATDAYTIIVTKRKKQRVEQVRLEIIL